MFVSCDQFFFLFNFFCIYSTPKPFWFFNKAGEKDNNCNSEQTKQTLYWKMEAPHVCFCFVFFFLILCEPICEEKKNTQIKKKEKHYYNLWGFGCQQKLTIFYEQDHEYQTVVLLLGLTLHSTYMQQFGPP